jgi:imidazole glycerol-phosphate synthase subunit HisF
MNKSRIIARIDIKNEHVIKGIHLEGLRKIGNPRLISEKYYDAGIDEIVFMDAVAAYYDRNSLSNIIEAACKKVFVPITVGGGLRTIDDIQTALNVGGDKVAINTKAVQNPLFIEEASKVFGSQCIVASIEAKMVGENRWEAYIENGREPTGLDVISWAKQLEELGAGEIMLTSVDKEGTKKGFDIELCQIVSETVSIPVIASGGAGQANDVVELFQKSAVDAGAIASLFHYDISTVQQVKRTMQQFGIDVRHE